MRSGADAMEQTSPVRRIAVLDDDASVLKALRRLLQMAGYQVSTYSNGPDLLRDMESSRPDCLLLDVHVPGMNGFEVLRRARAAHAGTSAIVITAFEELAAPTGGRLRTASQAFRQRCSPAIDRRVPGGDRLAGPAGRSIRATAQLRLPETVP
jgi:CheY-like chemotaxis protein